VLLAKQINDIPDLPNVIRHPHASTFSGDRVSRVSSDVAETGDAAGRRAARRCLRWGLGASQGRANSFCNFVLVAVATPDLQNVLVRSWAPGHGTVAGPWPLRRRFPRPVGQGRHCVPEPGTLNTSTPWSKVRSTISSVPSPSTSATDGAAGAPMPFFSSLFCPGSGMSTPSSQ